MANEEHVALLKKGAEVWNKSREENPNIVPDLRGARLSCVDLRGANLANAKLAGADFSEASLIGVDFSHAKAGLTMCRAIFTLVFTFVLWLLGPAIPALIGGSFFILEDIVENFSFSENLQSSSDSNALGILELYAIIIGKLFFEGIYTGNIRNMLAILTILVVTGILCPFLELFFDMKSNMLFKLSILTLLGSCVIFTTVIICILETLLCLIPIKHISQNTEKININAQVIFPVILIIIFLFGLFNLTNVKPSDTIVGMIFVSISIWFVAELLSRYILHSALGEDKQHAFLQSALASIS
jgi:hypothetical protein